VPLSKIICTGGTIANTSQGVIPVDSLMKQAPSSVPNAMERCASLAYRKRLIPPIFSPVKPLRPPELRRHST